MTPTEAVLVLRKVRAYRPAQIVDELTGDAWHEALADQRYPDALKAVTNIARQSSDWIDPARIIAEIKKIRAARRTAHGDPIPPPDLTPLQTLAWQREAWRRIGDGETIPGRGTWKPEDPPEIEGAA